MDSGGAWLDPRDTHLISLFLKIYGDLDNHDSLVITDEDYIDFGFQDLCGSKKTNARAYLRENRNNVQPII